MHPCLLPLANVLSFPYWPIVVSGKLGLVESGEGVQSLEVCVGRLI